MTAYDKLRDLLLAFGLPEETETEYQTVPRPGHFAAWGSEVEDCCAVIIGFEHGQTVDFLFGPEGEFDRVRNTGGSDLDKLTNLFKAFGLKQGTTFSDSFGGPLDGHFGIVLGRDDKFRKTIVLGNGKGFAEHYADFDFEKGAFVGHGVRS